MYFYYYNLLLLFLQFIRLEWVVAKGLCMRLEMWCVKMLLKGLVAEDAHFPLWYWKNVWGVCALMCTHSCVVQSHLVPETKRLAPRLCRHRHTCFCSRMRGLNLSQSHPILLPINIWLLLDSIIRLIHRMWTCSLARMTMHECICIMDEQPPNHHLSDAHTPLTVHISPQYLVTH